VHFSLSVTLIENLAILSGIFGKIEEEGVRLSFGEYFLFILGPKSRISAARNVRNVWREAFTLSHDFSVEDWTISSAVGFFSSSIVTLTDAGQGGATAFALGRRFRGGGVG
jgi:hypothetical protein